MRTSRGFSLIELIVVIVLMAILVGVAAPRFFGQGAFEAPAYARELASAARYAQKLAVVSGCPVDFTVGAGGYALFRALRPPRFVEVTLQHLPGPIFIAYVAPALATQGARGFAAAAAVVVTQATTRNLAAAIAVGVGAMWLLGLVR